MAITVACGAVAGGCSTHEIMDTEYEKEVERFDVNSVTLTDGPNIRKNPTIPSEEENIIIDFGEQGQKAEVPYRGPGYYYCNEYDPNGGWYGFPADKLADELFKDAFIDGKEAKELVNKDKDGVVWINEKYVEVKKAESAQN